MDLSNKNAAKFEKAVAPYVKAARKIGGGRRSSGRSPGSGSRSAKKDLGAIREWARGQGLKVSERGRISNEIQEAYHRAK